MEKTVGISLTAAPVKKGAARVALVDLHEPTRQVLADCFRQFGVETVTLTGNVPHRLQWEKFEACVVKLVPESQPVMESARSSPSNNRMVIYGLGGNAQEALQFSKYGVNAMFQEPIERSSALKLVRATQMLVLHEFRRYARVPVITQVNITTKSGDKCIATSREISSGGMSMTSNEDLPIGTQVEVSLALLTLPRVWVRGSVSWRKNKSYGVRFDPLDDRKKRLKEWVEGYIEH